MSDAFMVRYDVDRLEREVAGVRARVDVVNSRIGEIQRIASGDLAIVKAAISALHQELAEVLKLTRETHTKVAETLEQVRVAQEQQGRMLHEIAELRGE